jgi:methylmalonyl-CoA/ethylmalonyl-CoA epimerase
MREPVFTETLQIAIVVRDLEAAMRTYVDDYGIGPWDIHEFNPGNVKDLREYGQPVERSWRLAVAMVGQVMWELIEPLDDESVYARFLAEKGEGVHHIGVAAPAFDETVAAQAKRGHGVVLSGEFNGIRVAYLATDRDLGVIIEIFSGTSVRTGAGNDLGAVALVRSVPAVAKPPRCSASISSLARVQWLTIACGA